MFDRPPLPRSRDRRSPASRRAASTGLIAGAIVAVSLLALVGGFLWFSRTQEDANDPLIHVVQRGTFQHIVSEKGEFESSNNVEVRCEVKARKSQGTEILEVVPEGTNVVKDDVLARLDSSGLELDLVEQQIVCTRSEAMMIKARNLLAAAEIAKTEYEKGTYEQEKQELEKLIFKAEEDLRRAEQYARYSERLAAKGYVTELQLVGDRFAVEEARKELQSAQTKLFILENYTKKKELMHFDADIKTAEAEYNAEKRSYELEQDNLQEIKDQIELCTIRSPVAGEVVYANRKAHRGSSNEFIVEPGAEVRENQVLFRLPDRTKMQVQVEVSETDIPLIQSGMRATIELGTNDEDEIMHGVVTRVNEYPEPSWSSSAPKEYLAFVEIIDPLPTLRTGLTAKVHIEVDRVDDALEVPVQAVHLHGDRYYCLVQSDRGGWMPVEVNIGATNGETVVIREGPGETGEGLQVGMRVTLTPEKFLDQVDLPELTDAPPRLPQAPRQLGSSPTPQAADGSAPDDQTEGPSAARRFAQLDTDSDGKLSVDEIPADLRGALLATDSDGDGLISLSEFSRGMSQRRSRESASPSDAGGSP